MSFKSGMLLRFGFEGKGLGDEAQDLKFRAWS